MHKGEIKQKSIKILSANEFHDLKLNFVARLRGEQIWNKMFLSMLTDGNISMCFAWIVFSCAFSIIYDDQFYFKYLHNHNDDICLVPRIHFYPSSNKTMVSIINYSLCRSIIQWELLNTNQFSKNVFMNTRFVRTCSIHYFKCTLNGLNGVMSWNFISYNSCVSTRIKSLYCVARHSIK